MTFVLLVTFISIIATNYFIVSSIVNFTWQHGRAPTGRELLVISIEPLIIIVPVIVVVLTLIIFISHRIVGPLNRLKQGMEKVGKGDLSVKLKFRKYDDFHDVADSFNKMVEGLREKYLKDQNT